MAKLSNREKAEIVDSLSGQHDLDLLLKIIGLPRSSYYYARKHPKAATRPDVHEKVKEIFNRTANGCGHRQILMRLRREFNITISKKTVLKVMRELGLVCKIRRKGFRKYSSFKGVTSTVPNLIARDFKAEAPFTKIGTDVTEFALPFGKVYLAQVVDFSLKRDSGLLHQSISKHAPTKRDVRCNGKGLAARACPILHSDMGWQYQNPAWIGWTKKHNVTRSMSRKGNCLDNAATEQAFGHMKDEFFKGQSWDAFDAFKSDLTAYIAHWNTKRPQERLDGYAPSEYRQRYVEAG